MRFDTNDLILGNSLKRTPLSRQEKHFFKVEIDSQRSSVFLLYAVNKPHEKHQLQASLLQHFFNVRVSSPPLNSSCHLLSRI